MANIRQDRIQLSIEINGVKAGSTFKELRTNARDLTRELDKLTPGTDEFIKKAEELKKVNNVLADIRTTTRGVAQAMDEPRTATQRLTDFFKKGAVAALAFFSTQQVIQWGKEFVGWITRGSLALEGMRDKTLQTFGDSIDIVQDFAEINASSIGVTEEKYASLASNVGALLVSMGLQREEAAKLSVDTLQLSAAIADWKNGTVSVEQAQDLLGKAMQGQVKGLRQLGINITETDIKQRLAAKGQEELTGAMLKQARAQSILELAMERSRDAQIEFAASGDDAGRAVARIAASWEQFKENILSGVLPVFKSLTNTIANVVSPMKRQSDQISDQQSRYNILIDTLKRGNVSEETRLKLITRINEIHKTYNAALIDEKTSLEDIAKAAKDVNEQFTQRILLLATEEKLRDVSKEQIDLKTQELELAQDLTAAQNELAKFDINKVGQGREGADRAFIDAATAAQSFTDKLNANQAAQEATQKKFEDISKAARELGLDIAAILSDPGGGDGNDDPGGNADQRLKDALKRIEDRYRLEELIKVQSIENLRENDEVYEAERARIALETSIKIATAQSELYKAGTLENLQLQQKAADDLATLQNNADKLTLDQRISQVHLEINARRQAIDESLKDESITQAEYSRERELLEKESAIRIAQLRAQALIPDSAEARQAAQDILDKEKELNRLRLEASVKTKEEEIELSRQLAIQGLNDLFLAEEDLQKSREIINREADISILETRLALYKQGTEQYIELENQLADLRRQRAGSAGFQVDLPDNGFFSTPEDRDSELERRAQIEQAGLDITEQFAQASLEIKQQAIQEELQTRLDAISASEQAALEAAEGDAALQKKIRSDADRQRLAAEKQAAKERQAIARKEAVIQGALAFIKALPNYVAAFAAAAAAVFQITQIDAQKFDKGGHTGRRGMYRDSSGHEVAGVVHANEYVIPKNVLDDPATAPVVNYLERVRRAKGGYVDGGFTSVNTRPVIPVTSLNTAAAAIDAQKLDQMIVELREIKRVVAAWPREMRANVVLTDLERKAAELNYIREQSVV